MEKNHSQVVDELFNFDYHQLRRLAHRVRSGWQGDPTLGTTVLIHEAYLRLARDRGRAWDRDISWPWPPARCARCSSTTPSTSAPTSAVARCGRPSLDGVYLTPGAIEDLLELDARSDGSNARIPGWDRSSSAASLVG